MRTILNIARLTIRETQRRRILWVALFMDIAFLVVFGLGFHYIVTDFEREAFNNNSEFPGLFVYFVTLEVVYAIKFMVIVMASLL